MTYDQWSAFTGYTRAKYVVPGVSPVIVPRPTVPGAVITPTTFVS